ncbi:MAG TPA: PEP/pyruvate-binding domain-containing protein [Gemmatimonadaceae bacterium]|nr:PEP/pyruvate-binding domain-containing protein [Gemmatimonadaceae bacterium]
MTTAMLGPSSSGDAMRADGGGKAANLHALTARGYPVPEWICVPASVFDRCRDSGIDEEAAAGIRRALEDAKLLDCYVAVRSSGLEEDSAEHSFAGQFESYLFQRGEPQILEAVQKCWRSASSQRLTAYRQTAGLDGRPVRMGVVIQRMVDADVAGVAFSRNPLRPTDRGSLVVDSVWGQGEGLVSGALDADHFEVDRETLEFRATVAHKRHALVQDPAGGTREVALDPQRGDSASLTAEQVREVTRLALGLERDFGGPQDCEWAYAGGKLFCLQTRPITTLPPDALFDERVSGNEATIWDNSNIIESYAGVTTPLTFTHVSRCYSEVYLQFCRLMAVPEHVISAHEAMFRNMLGLVRGRVYYNLVNWYRLLSLFPGMARSKGFMETMMGVKQSLSPELAALFEDLSRAPRYSVWRRLRLVASTAFRLTRVRRGIEEFLARITRVYRPLEKADLRALSFPEQIALYRRLENEVLKQWTAPIVSDTRCMVAFGLLRELTVRWLERSSAVTNAASIQNDLLCGEGDLMSTEPTRLLMRIAARVDRSDPTDRARFLAESPDQLRASLAGGFMPDIAADFEDFLDRYGFRCADELKLEEPDLHDDPRFVLASVQGYVRHAKFAADAMESRELDIRRNAEDVAHRALSPWRRAIYFRAVRWARRAVSDRERLRFERTRTFGVTRRLFRAMGANLAKLGVLDDERDIFFLTLEELMAFHDGRSVLTDFRPLVEVRRREFDEYRRTPAPPDRFVTRGAAGAALRYPMVLVESDLLAGAGGDDDPALLRGTPCCPGVVEAPIRVARGIEDAEGIQGEILVTERTDPGWVPLFPTCAGLIIERGSLLSHSAVVARELGVPTIVGVSGNPVQRLKTGQRVRMDAGRGEVRIL